MNAHEALWDEALDALGAAIDDAAPAPRLADEGDQYAAAGYGGDEDDGDDAPPLPPDCPATCLGVQDQRCWYLDYNGQIISLDMANKHGKGSLTGLFGPRYGWLESHFPQWSKPIRERDPGTNEWIEIKPSEIVGFDQAKASQALIVECTRKGIFDPAGRIRGAGAHRGAAGGLIIHLGDVVMRRTVPDENGTPDEIRYFGTGLHGEHVYPAAAAVPRPWKDTVTDEAGIRALDIIRKWHWRRPVLDPLLVLGGIGASMIGGALEWRSNIWVTGSKGTGKSTLNGKRGVLDQLFGKGQMRSADTTAAGIRQRLRNSTVPVFLDEVEAEEDERRAKSILELARVSSSGDDAHRGGHDHRAVDFTLESAFWASSILIPQMQPADRSRWAICQLNPIPIGAKRLDLNAEKLPELGRRLMRRMVDGWHRWDATIDAYTQALSDLGHSSRACMQFGTLLAAADLLLYDHLPDEDVIEGITALCAKSMLREVSDSAEEHELCLNHLRTTMVQSRGGDERESIGSWIGRAVQEICDPQDDGLGLGLGSEARKRGHIRLQELGLKLVQRTDKGAATWAPGKRGYLAVANSHQALAGVFAGKKWAGGVWAQALGYTPGAIEGVKVKFHRLSLTATLVPLEEAIDECEIPPPARWREIDEGDQA